MDFALEASDTLTGPELARLHGVSAQTIANWRKAGLPVAGQGGRGPLYDREACQRWIRANTGGKIRGGRRPNAGRKRRTDPPDETFRRGVEAAEARRAAAGRLRVEDLLNLTHAELVAVVSLDPDESGLSKSSLERLKLIQDTRARHREEQEKLGKLVDAEEAAAAFAARLTAIRERLEALPHRLLRAVMSAGEVAGEREVAVLEALGREVAAVVGEVRRGPPHPHDHPHDHPHEPHPHDPPHEPPQPHHPEASPDRG